MIVIIQSNALHDNAEHLNALIGNKHVVSKELIGGGEEPPPPKVVQHVTTCLSSHQPPQCWKKNRRSLAAADVQVHLLQEWQSRNGLQEGKKTGVDDIAP